MPIVKSSNLPTFDRLIREGRPVLPTDRAITQDIRELHIGFLNMMPDAAMESTERQWFRLIGESNRVAQIYIHPFNLPVVPRGDDAQAHIDQHYSTFEQLKEDGLDALIITGANEETNPHVSKIENWAPLKEVIEWAYSNVSSTIFSCFAAHALMTHEYNEEPHWRDEKRLGIYSHNVTNREHSLVRGMNTKFDAPHSRFSEITAAQFEQVGMNVLAKGIDDLAYMAVSKDGFRQICLQGHPEYDTFSLLKEFKRDVGWFQDGTVKEYPTMPINYFSPEAEVLLENHKQAILNNEPSTFPEEELSQVLDNTWVDSARSFIAGWIGHVYQVTNVDRKKQFMDGIDLNNPLGN